MASVSVSKEVSETKKRKDAKRSRKWNRDELQQFAIVLSDEEKSFALNLKKLPLSKSSNNEIFAHIKKLLDLLLQDKSFRDQSNRNNFVLKDGTTVKYVNLDTPIEKLRRKYANLKKEWRKLKERLENGSGLSPKNESLWYKYLYLMCSETNEGTEQAAESAAVFCMDNFGEDPGNDRYLENEASNFSDDECSNFSVSLSTKLLEKNVRSTPLPSESEEE